jgi:hypothetical protein
MSGCLRSIGCLVVLVVLGGVGWFSRDVWLPRVTGEPRTTSTLTWEPVSTARGERARRAVDSLARRTGPVFVSLSGAEVASLLLAEAERRYPALVEDADATVVGDRIRVRATADLSQLRGLDGLGPLGAVLDSRQRVELAGSVEVLEAGVAQLVVQDARIGDIQVPRPLIPRLVRQLDRGARPPSAAANALVFPLPPHVGDLRIARGRVTLYKTVQ